MGLLFFDNQSDLSNMLCEYFKFPSKSIIFIRKIDFKINKKSLKNTIQNIGQTNEDKDLAFCKNWDQTLRRYNYKTPIQLYY